MLKWLGGIVIGAVLGAGAVLLLSDEQPEVERASPPARPIQEPQTLAPTTREAIPEQIPSTLADIHRLPNGFDQTVALYNLLNSSDVGMVEALLDEARALERSTRRYTTKHAIFTRYVQLDPNAAMARVVADGNDLGQLGELFATWATNDPDGALAGLDALVEPERTETAKFILNYAEGLDNATQNAVATKFSLQRELDRKRSLEAAETDPAAAWHAALLLDGDSRRDSLYTIAAQWAGSDPVAALEAAGDLANKRLGEDMARTVVQEWMRTDQDAALGWVLALPPSSHRVLLETALRGLSRTNPKAALDALGELDDPMLYAQVTWSAASNWASSDPYAAFDWAMSQHASQRRQFAINQVMTTLAGSSPEEALALASRLDDGLQRRDAFTSVLRTWARTDARAAARWIDASTQPIGNAAAAIIHDYAQLDPREAFEWVLSRNAAQSGLADPLIYSVAMESPDEARRMFNRIPDGPTKLSAARHLVNGLLPADPRAAVREISRLGLDDTRDLYTGAFRMWSESDPAAATAFLPQVPAESRERAVIGILYHAVYSGNDVALAERMYKRLTNDDMRRQAASTLHSMLRDIDPERAKRYE